MTIVWAAVLAASMLLSTGCGPSGPVGSWVVDADATFESMERAMGKELPEGPALERMKAELRREWAAQTMTFRPGAKFEMVDAQGTRTGTWSLKDGRLSLMMDGGGVSERGVRIGRDRMWLSSLNPGPHGAMGDIEIVYRRK